MGSAQSRQSLIRKANPTHSQKNPGNMSSAMDFVEDTIANHPVVVFSKTYCPYCVKAKEAIKQAGGKVDAFQGAHVIELDIRPDGSAIQDALREKTGRGTVPNVFIGGQTVGGGDDVEQYLHQGILPQMLRAAPQQLAAAAAAPSSKHTQTVPVALVHATTTTTTPTAQDSNTIAADADTPVDDATTTTDDTTHRSQNNNNTTTNMNTSLITFGAGCFWGVQLAFQRKPGVVNTEVGYSNGNFSPVTYNAVCTGRTGHAEVVRVWYNPQLVSLKDLIALWEERNDPTSLNKQGNDRGTQYRSAIYYHNDEQRDAALAWKEEAASRLKKPIVTEIAAETGYSPAEEYHQRYLERRGQSADKGATSKIRCYG